MFGQQCGTARTSSVRMYLDGLVELKDSSTGQVPRKSFAGYECAWSWMWCCLIKVVTVITSECRCGKSRLGGSGWKTEKITLAGRQMSHPATKTLPAATKGNKNRTHVWSLPYFNFNLNLRVCFISFGQLSALLTLKVLLKSAWTIWFVKFHLAFTFPFFFFCSASGSSSALGSGSTHNFHYILRIRNVLWLLLASLCCS